MADTIKNKFFSGIAWSFVQNIAVKAMSVVFTIVLARLLFPEDYGLIGMLSIFIAVSEVFIQSGISQALIQKTDCTDEDFSTAFYFNVSISVFIYLVLFITAPYIADFYHEPQLVTLTRVLSLNFVFGSLNIVQQSKLTKAMNFKPLAIISLACTLFSGVVGIVMAYKGLGVWALVGQTLSATLLRVFFFPMFTKWHPNRLFSYQSFIHLWGYGSKILVTGIIDVIIRNLSNILIGRFYDKEQVGYFSKARNFSDIPSQTISSILGTVIFPVLSEIQDDKLRLTFIYKKVLLNTIVLTFPIMIILALLAKPLVVLLFTEKWLPAVPLLQALMLARIFLPLNYLNAGLLQGTGEAKLYMKLYFIAGPLSLIAIAVAIPFGVLAMAWATFISALLYYLVFAIVIGAKIHYSFFCQVWDERATFISLTLMSICVYLSIHWLNDLWLQLVIGSVVGIIVYMGCCKFFNLVDNDLIQLFRSKLKLI